MAGRIGGVFERGEQLRERLCFPPPASQPPAEAAPSVQSPPPVPPSRWKLASIRTTFAFLHGYSLPGVSLYVRHCGIALAAAQFGLVRPGPGSAPGR